MNNSDSEQVKTRGQMALKGFCIFDEWTGLQDAAAMLKHLAAVKGIAAQPAGLKLNIVGPAAQLEKLRPHLEPAGAVFWQLDTGAFWM